MPDEPSTKSNQGNPADDAVDGLLDAFEAAWKQGQHPVIEDFLARVPVEQRLLLLREIVQLDIEYRLRLNESTSLDSYTARFPELKQTDVWPSMVAAEARIRARLNLGKDLSANQTAPKLGNFFLLEKFPETGQSDAFLAFDPIRRQQVVIKQLKMNADGQARDLFIQEARTLWKLHSDALPAIFSVDTLGGRPILVMEYIPGPDLGAWIAKNQITPRNLARMLAPIARALHIAHQAAIIHRDIKPANILVDSRTGRCKLIDFGLAEVSQPLDMHVTPDAESCTPNYASPEQANAGRQDARTDVWGLGGVLYYALTRRPLYLAPLALGYIRDEVKKGKFDRSPLDAKTIPAELKNICLRALAADPSGRYPTALKMAERLERFARRPTFILGLLIFAFVALVAIGLTFYELYEYNHGSVDWPADNFHISIMSGDHQGDIEKDGRADPGSQIIVEATIPPNLNAGLFLLDGKDGTLSRKASLQSSDSNRVLRFPSGAATATVHDTGITDFCFVCLNRTKVPEVRDIQDAPGLQTPLPALRPQTSIRLTPEGVVVATVPSATEGKSRGFGEAPDVSPSTLNQAMSALEDIRVALKRREAAFQGIAFSH